MNPGRGCFAPAPASPGRFAATSNMRGSRGGGADPEGYGVGGRNCLSFLWSLSKTHLS